MYTLDDLSKFLGAEIIGNAKKELNGLNTLQNAQQNELSFLANPIYQCYLESTQAGAVILEKKNADKFSGNALIVENAYLAYARISVLFDQKVSLQLDGIHKSAVISDSAQIAPTVAIGAQVFIGNNVILAEGVRIDSGVVIHNNAVIGKGSYIKSNVTICHSVFIGEQVIIHNGAVIGADGFGNAKDGNNWIKIAQLGSVIIEDNVEIGANSCIDRGALGNTVIGKGVRIDNLVQIGHNVVIGENTALAANVGVSGSTKIGKNCAIGGGVGFAGHIELADNIFVYGMSSVTKSILKAGVYASGAGGCVEASVWKRNIVHLKKLHQIVKRVTQIEKQVNE